MKKITVLLQTSKDRLRYLDTTFNSITKVLPPEIEVYIACDQPSDQLLKYLTSNDDILLEDQYLYPNENVSWKRFVGVVENKKNVTGIVGKYKKLLLLDSSLHMYEKLVISLNTVITDDNNDYIIYIEDDVIFKENFFSVVLKCIQEIEYSNIGRVSLFKSNHIKEKTQLIKEKNTGWCGSNVCLLLKSSVLRVMNLSNYKFNIYDLPDYLQREVNNSNILPQVGGDHFLTNILRKFTNTSIYISDSICQHIGVLSALYENVSNLEHQINTSLKRSFFSHERVVRIDFSCRPFSFF